VGEICTSCVIYDVYYDYSDCLEFVKTSNNRPAKNCSVKKH
jgi:hypothetical protein